MQGVRGRLGSRGRPLLLRRSGGPPGSDSERPEPQHRQPTRPSGAPCLRGPAPAIRDRRGKLLQSTPGRTRCQTVVFGIFERQGQVRDRPRLFEVNVALFAVGWTRAPSSTPMAGAAMTDLRSNRVFGKPTARPFPRTGKFGDIRYGQNGYPVIQRIRRGSGINHPQMLQFEIFDCRPHRTRRAGSVGDLDSKP